MAIVAAWFCGFIKSGHELVAGTACKCDQFYRATLPVVLDHSASLSGPFGGVNVAGLARPGGSLRFSSLEQGSQGFVCRSRWLQKRALANGCEVLQIAAIFAVSRGECMFRRAPDLTTPFCSVYGTLACYGTWSQSAAFRHSERKSGKGHGDNGNQGQRCPGTQPARRERDAAPRPVDLFLWRVGKREVLARV